MSVIINCILFSFPVPSSLAPNKFSSGQDMSGFSCCKVTASFKLGLAMNLWLLWQQPSVILGVSFWGLCLRLSPSFLICFHILCFPDAHISLFISLLKSFLEASYLPACLGWLGAPGVLRPAFSAAIPRCWALRPRCLRESCGKVLLALHCLWDDLSWLMVWWPHSDRCFSESLPMLPSYNWRVPCPGAEEFLGDGVTSPVRKP